MAANHFLYHLSCLACSTVRYIVNSGINFYYQCISIQAEGYHISDTIQVNITVKYQRFICRPPKLSPLLLNFYHEHKSQYFTDCTRKSSIKDQFHLHLQNTIVFSEIINRSIQISLCCNIKRKGQCFPKSQKTADITNNYPNIL